MKKSAMLFAALLSGAAVATPVVSDVSIAQQSPKLATLSFKLTKEPAVVTIDIQTNDQQSGVWASIGADKFANLEPNLCGRRLEPGTYAMTWNPRATWPDQRIAEGGLRAVVTAWQLDNLPDYMAVDLKSPSNVVFYVSEETLPFDIKDDRWLTDYFLMKRMHAAGLAWMMGTPSYAFARGNNEVPTVVTLSEDYYISVFETFEGQYYKVMGSHGWSSDNLIPAVYGFTCHSLRGTTGDGTGDAAYSWPKDGHAVADDSFFGKLRAKTGVEFDLPTGCQWEFACRGGTCAPYIDGSDRQIRNATNVNARAYQPFIELCVAPVITYAGVKYPDMTRGGTKLPNGYGLYDMLGNVWEWCLDWLPTAAQMTGEDLVDYPGPEEPSVFSGEPVRMARGASTYGSQNQLSSSYKGPTDFTWKRQSTDTGFRVACPAVIK